MGIADQSPHESVAERLLVVSQCSFHLHRSICEKHSRLGSPGSAKIHAMSLNVPCGLGRIRLKPPSKESWDLESSSHLSTFAQTSETASHSKSDFFVSVQRQNKSHLGPLSGSLYLLGGCWVGDNSCVHWEGLRLPETSRNLSGLPSTSPAASQKPL